MASEYYDPTNKGVSNGDTSDETDVNAINTAVNTGFELVEADIEALEDEVGTGAEDSEAWATNEQGDNPDDLQPTKWSSLANAEEAQGWASAADGAGIPLADGTSSTEESAKTHAANAETSADEAAASAAIAAGLITNADDVIGTAPIVITSTPDGANFDLTIEIDGITAISTDGTLAGNSDAELPTERAVKTYVDTEVAAVQSDADDNAAAIIVNAGAISDLDDATVKSVVGTADEIVVDSSDSENPELSMDEDYQTNDRISAESFSSAVTLDVSSAEVFTLTVTGAVTIDFENFPSGFHKTVMLVLTNAGTNVTWGSEVEWPEGTEPELSTTGRDRLVFASEDAGTTVDGGLCGITYA